jgi:hypothetical protein
MQVVDRDGNVYGQGLQITSIDGKPKTISTPGGIAGGDLSGSYPNPSVIKLLGNTIPINANGYLKNDGSGGLTWATVSTGITINTTPITGGTSGRLLFDNAGTVGEASGVNWNSSTSVLTVGITGANGTIQFPTTTSGFVPSIISQFAGNNLIFTVGSRSLSLSGSGQLTTSFNTTITGSTGGTALTVAQGNSGWTPVADFNGSSGTALRINTNGNILIGTTTDAGYKLDVAGTIRSQGSLVISNPLFTQGGSITHSANATLSIIGGPASESIVLGPSNRIFINAQQTRFPNGSVQMASTLTIGSTGATSTNMLLMQGSITAGSALGRGIGLDTTLVAAANNDVLVGLDVKPTYTNGAFTGLTNVDLRTSGANVTIGSSYGYGALYGYANDGIVQIKTAATYKTQMWFRPSGNANNYNSSYWSRIENDSGTMNIFGSNYGALYIASSAGGGNGAGISFSGATGIGTNALSILGPTNSGRIALTTYGSSPITINGGNLLVNTTTDAGYKADINGTGRFTGNLTIGTMLIGDIGGNRVFNTAGLTIDYGALYPFSITGTSTASITPAGTLTLKGITHLYSATEVYKVQKTTNVGHLQITLDIIGSDAVAGYNYGTKSGNVRIYPGAESFSNGYGNVVIAHDGTTNRGNVLIGTSTNVPSAIVNVNSTTQGFLAPRMSNAQMIAIATPSEGLMVYDLTNRKLCCYDGATWQPLF